MNTSYSRTDFLDLANEIISHDRNSQYGEPEDAFKVIADYWSVYLKNRYEIEISSSDVAVLMVLMKIARLTQNPFHKDSIVDGIGYLACYGEIVSDNLTT
jgi:hypothetical protein